MINAENFASALPWRRRPSAFYDSYFSFRKTGDRVETPAEKDSGKILVDVRKAACAKGEKAAGVPITTRSLIETLMQHHCSMYSLLPEQEERSLFRRKILLCFITVSCSGQGGLRGGKGRTEDPFGRQKSAEAGRSLLICFIFKAAWKNNGLRNRTF
ncbi:MAG: hypothetical protein EA344_09300 [Alkalicoccus sp.]|nr:MAG: hypothetical protein EA344_09300 [Alkalicoccus sp.]